MAIDDMVAKSAKAFENIELEVQLKQIITDEEKGKVTLVFHAPAIKNDYRKNYLIEDVKGRIDFNRAMFALGCTKNNYDKWLNKLIEDKILLKISVNAQGFIRYIKVLEQDRKDMISKSLFLDGIEGLGEKDREFLMTLSLDILKKEFGH